MKNKENNINFCKEIYLKCDLKGIHSFDSAVFRINTNQIYPKPERLTCNIYYSHENKVNLPSADNKTLLDTLLVSTKVNRSGWIEWTVDSKFNEFRENKELLLKIVVINYN